MQRFVRWWREGAYSPTGDCFDIGIATRAALARFERTGDPASGDPDPMSAGNGCLMRLAQVSILYWDGHERARRGRPPTMRDDAWRWRAPDSE
jgi:ADP-ribosylglycohydrolase